VYDGQALKTDNWYFWYILMLLILYN
jgi:hypothetical protein